MPDSNQARQNEVKVEDLLRLKRAERPDKAFWNQFDRELHQRMLQALVKKDPWYLQLLRGLTGRIAQTATLGAAAALAAMLVIRPALVEGTKTDNAIYAADTNDAFSIVDALESLQAQGVLPGLPELRDFNLAAVTDYQLETISGKKENAEYIAEYSLDSFEVASYGSDAYLSDSASFALSGVATGLIY